MRMRLPDLLRRAPTIRQWLAMLLAAFIVPAAAAVLALFAHSYGRERAGVERANLDVARALMQAIDRELASAQGALQALGTSPNLDRGDLRAFYEQATSTRPPAWRWWTAATASCASTARCAACWARRRTS